MKVLITGHEGFIGRHLMAILSRTGHEVYGLDIKSRNNIQEMTGPDIANDDLVYRVLSLNRCDVVFHLAATCSTSGSLARPMETFRNTARGTVNVIDACRQLDIPLIMTSSVKARDALTPYGVAKRMGELWALDHIRAYGMKIVINRPGTVYGPGQEGSEESGWIAWFLKAKKEHLPVTINKPGTQIRDLLHVKDYVRLLFMQMLDLDTFAGRIWDVGGGWNNAVSVLEMADLLALDWSFGPSRYGDEQEYVGVNDAPDWEPTIHWRDSEVFKDV